MATQPKPARSGSVRRLLQESSPPVRYDATRGLARHEQLVAGRSPLPEWASGMKPISPPRGVSAFAKRAWWLGSALTLAGALWLGSSQVRRAEPTTRAVGADARASAGAHEARPGEARSASAREPRRLDPLALTTSPDNGRAAGQRAGSAAAGERDEPRPLQGALVPRAPTTDEREDPTGEPARTDPVAPTSAALAGLRAPTAEPLAPDSPAAGRLPPQTNAPDLRSHAQTPRASAPSPEGSTRAARKTRSRATAQSPQDAEEMRQLAEAERLLAAEPVRALRIAREGHVAFRGGYFSQERRYIEVMALFALGRHGEARAHATWFLRDYPNGPYRHRVETELLRFPVH